MAQLYEMYLKASRGPVTSAAPLRSLKASQSEKGCSERKTAASSPRERAGEEKKTSLFSVCSSSDASPDPPQIPPCHPWVSSRAEKKRAEQERNSTRNGSDFCSPSRFASPTLTFYLRLTSPLCLSSRGLLFCFCFWLIYYPPLRSAGRCRGAPPSCTA